MSTAAPSPSPSRAFDPSFPLPLPAHPPSPSPTSPSPSPSKRLPIIIDCDPGHDDAFAIILAAYHPTLHLLGLTTCGGNSTLQRTTLNALKVLHIAGLDPLHIPVVPGRADPLLRTRIDAEHSGPTGLDGPHFPPVPTPPHPGHAIDFIYSTAKAWLEARGTLPTLPSPLSPTLTPTDPSTVLSHPDGVTLLAIGPLTNIALLLLRYPDVRLMLRSIVLMGGALTAGNATPHAEFNLWMDPEAARVVFQSGVPLVMVPLEVTHTALATPAVVGRIEGTGTLYGRLLVELLGFFGDAYKKLGMEAPPLHDPCAVAWLLDEGMFEWEWMRVEVDCGEEQAGRTVVVQASDANKEQRPNVRVCTKMDVDRFWELMLAAITASNARSPING